MKNFKVRYWDKKLKVLDISERTFKKYPNWEELIVMLGTDVNGVFVYDGDIVISESEDYTSYLPIIFNNGAFWVDESFEKDGTYLKLLCEWDEKLKVVGNIYENPELLKINK